MSDQEKHDAAEAVPEEWRGCVTVKHFHSTTRGGVYLAIEAEAPVGMNPPSWNWWARDAEFSASGTVATLDDAQAAAEVAVPLVHAQRRAAWEECQRTNAVREAHWREFYANTRDCPRCDGEGGACDRCNGTGRVSK